MNSKQKKRFDKRNLVVAFAGIAVALLVAELALQLMFASNQTALLTGTQSNSFIAKNPYWLVWHHINNTTEVTSPCFSGTLRTNEYGMKDAPVQAQLPKIALIGDSYVEGFGVPNEATMSHYLDSVYANHYDVLNFGCSGGFSNVQELSLYENFASGFKPKVVCWFFLNYNDFYDNADALQQGLIDSTGKFTYRVAASFDEVKRAIVRHDHPRDYTNSVNGLYTVQAVQKGMKVLSLMATGAAGARDDYGTALAEIYTEAQNPQIDVGLEVFENCLQRFQALCAHDSATLVLIQLPDPYQTNPTWLANASNKIDAPLDATRPNRQIAALCKQYGVRYLDMYPAAMQYIEQHAMEYPYLYNECDRHFSPEGNAFAASVVQQYLADSLGIK